MVTDESPVEPACNATDTRRDKRRRAILDAARALFFEKGYEATTLGEVVARSGGSLSTLYELFGNKPGLLAALVRERCEAIAAVVEGVGIAALPPRDALCTVGRHLVAQLTDPSSIALYRVVVAETPRQPELGRQFYAAGPEPGRRMMAGFLAGQTAQGALQVDDADEAALFFFNMLLGNYQSRLLCGLPAADDAAEVERHIGRTVDAFLRLYARR